jgi:hypothetical protein
VTITALIVALAVHAALPAPAAARTRGTPSSSQQPPLPRGMRSGLDARVATLTRALGLDATQQAALRKLLQDQRQQVQRIWNDEAVSATDRITATRMASMHTADSIRALLSEEQRKRYDPPPQDDASRTIGNAHVEEWMSGERKR